MLWVDGWGWANTSQGCSYSIINYQAVYNYIKQISPSTLLVNNVNEGTTAHTDIIDDETQFSGQMPPAGNTIPSEGNGTLRSNNGWFYTGSPPSSVGYKAAMYVGATILTMNSRNSTYLLDVPPDTTGFIPSDAVNRLAGHQGLFGCYPGLLAQETWPTAKRRLKVPTGADITRRAMPSMTAESTMRIPIQATPALGGKLILGAMTSIGENPAFQSLADGYDGLLARHHGPDLGGRWDHRFIQLTVAAESPQHLGRRPKRLHGRPDSPLLVCQRRHSSHGPICSRNVHGGNA